MTGGGGSPRIAVIIPTCRQPGLLGEAISSVVAQDCAFDLGVVVVDDGCPFDETRQIAGAFAVAHRNLIYVRQHNRGLSAARNAGARIALERWPSAQALFFLDSDNRLAAPALRMAMAALDAHPHADWVYPSISRFGAASAGHYEVPYRTLTHIAAVNICEMAGLIRRRVWEAGTSLDEDMRGGYEDWDFWLRALEQGFRGRPCAFGFEYRRRGASMLTASARRHDSLAARLKDGHRGLYQPVALMRREHAEAPRYAITSDCENFLLVTDPDAPGRRIGRADYVRLFHEAVVEPERGGVPPYLCILSAPVLNALEQFGLLHGLLARLERLSETERLATLIEMVDGAEIALEIRLFHSDGKEHGWFIAADRLKAMLGLVPPGQLTASLRPAKARPLRHLVRCTLPDRPAVDGPAPTGGLAQLWQDITGSAMRANHGRSAWREKELPSTTDLHKHMRAACGTGVMTPRCAGRRPKLGFVLGEEGPDETVLAMARAAIKDGIEPHLFLPGHGRVSDDLLRNQPFCSVNFAADAEDFRSRSRLRGLVAGMDHIVNCTGGADSVFADIRANGMGTMALLIGQDGDIRGHSRLRGLADHEQAYDLILTPDENTSCLLAALGVPMQKLAVASHAALGSLLLAPVQPVA